MQKVALLVPQVPQAVFLLRVPPNSHKNLRSYNELSKRSGVDISNVITRIYFDRTTQGTLLFSGVQWIDEAQAAAREAAYVEKKTDAIVGRNDVARPVSTASIAGIPQTQVGQMMIPAQQVQQPGPFPAQGAAQQTMMQTTPQGTPTSQSPSGTLMTPNTADPGGTAPTASLSNGPTSPPQRRRRRTSAEVQAANAATPAGQLARGQGNPPAGGAMQAPFPHLGQATTQPAQTDMSFGMSAGAPVGANSEVAQALDSFFQS